MSTSTSLDSNAVWLITGCSSGLGRAFAQKVYDAGHHVVATARNVSSLSYLPDEARVLKLAIDVTSKDSIAKGVEYTLQKFGRLDVVINNAGYALVGDTEVIPEADARRQLETIFWGPVFLMQEAVRVFREVNPPGRGGMIVNITSMGGSVTYGGYAFYHAGKFALEGTARSMAQEMKPEWNIRFLSVAPGGVRTNFAGSSDSGQQIVPRHPAYDTPSNPLTNMLEVLNTPAVRDTWCDANACAQLLFDTVMGKYADRRWPSRLLMGSDAVKYIRLDFERALKEIDDWKVEATGCSPAKSANLDDLIL